MNLSPEAQTSHIVLANFRFQAENRLTAGKKRLLPWRLVAFDVPNLLTSARKFCGVRLSDAEREQLQEAAVKRGWPLSTFLREAALAVAGEEAAEQRLEEAKQARAEAAALAEVESSSDNGGGFGAPKAERHTTRTWDSFESYRREKLGGSAGGPGVQEFPGMDA